MRPVKRCSIFFSVGVAALLAAAPAAEAKSLTGVGAIAQALGSLFGKTKKNKQSQAPIKSTTKTKFVKRQPIKSKSATKKKPARKSSPSGIIGRPVGGPTSR